ncbi:MAG: hypothetical protein ACJA0N_000837 [Pseudohongiellaceae bacterium]|jgi:hypothetical protein
MKTRFKIAGLLRISFFLPIAYASAAALFNLVCALKVWSGGACLTKTNPLVGLVVMGAVGLSAIFSINRRYITYFLMNIRLLGRYSS